MAYYHVDNYSIRQWSSRSLEKGSGGVAITAIYLFEGDTRRGQIYFYPDNAELRSPLHRPEKEQILLNFGMGQFQATLAMLASGAGIKIFYNSTTDAGLATVRVPPTTPELGEAVSTNTN